ncbi:MAG TPA: winged helix DNA-binding domain-containing protein, partial [Pyrinomonadaceae bacterium]
MNQIDLLVQRAANQKLSNSGFQRAVDVVRWFGAVQAQDFNAAKWALALRMSHATTSTAIEDAYNKGRILRTHLLRPTWHFVAPDDIRWLLELTAPRVNLRCGPNYRKLELDGPTFKRSNRILRNALQGGKHLTRVELKKALGQSGVDAGDTIRMAHIMLRAELDGVVCSGRRIGKQFSYALLDECVPVAKTLNRDEALVELMRRYFNSHGPATLPDFIWWSGLTAADARRGVAQLDRHLQKAVVDEKEFWHARTAAVPQRSAHSAHLLPVYDEYNVAYKDRQTALDLTDGKPAISAWDMLGPTAMLNGTIVGTWKAAMDKKSVTIVVNAARTLSKRERLAIAKAAERYARFLSFTPDCLK